MTLGEKIRILREREGMTMEELAAHLGVQRSAVNKYEKNMVTDLKRSQILTLCRVFRMPSSYFLDEDLDLSPVEIELITLWRGAEDTIKQAVLNNLRDFQKKDTSLRAE